MRCQDIMSSPVEMASEKEPVAAVARRMREGHVGFMPVCDALGRAIGAVTDRDIAVRACAADLTDAPIASIMTAELVTCAPDDGLERAEALMREHRTSRVLVVADGRAVGVISLADLALLDEATPTLRAIVARDVRAGDPEPAVARGWSEHQTRQRAHLVESLAQRGVADRAVLRALMAVPREAFLPPELATHAYDDRTVLLPDGRAIASPYVVAQMASALRPQAGERLLEIGAGTGYATVVFACLAGSVTAVEPDAALAQQTARRLSALGVTNVRVVCGDGADGSYQAIAVSTPGAVIPAALLEQLEVGGRLVAAVGPALIRLTRTGADSFRRDLIDL